MTGWQEHVAYILTILVGIIVIKILYTEKINDLLDYFGISTIEFKKEKENKMTNRQLKDKIEELNHEIKRKNEEIDMLKDKGNRTEIIVATRDDIDEAKCCQTCVAFQPSIFKGCSSCEQKIIMDYEDVNIKESKCRYYLRNDAKIIALIKEIREINEHSDRIKKAEPKIIKL